VAWLSAGRGWLAVSQGVAVMLLLAAVAVAAASAGRDEPLPSARWRAPPSGAPTAPEASHLDANDLLDGPGGVSSRDIYVDPSEDGSNLAAAMATIAKFAQSAPSSVITVHLRPGVHNVPRGGLTVTGAHSPSRGGAVRWAGGRTASISSQVLVEGWLPVGAADPGLRAKGAFVARAPAALQGTSVRHLWVDGQRAPRTRRAVAAALPGLALTNNSKGYSVVLSKPMSWSNPGEVEFVYSGVGSDWSESRCAVDSTAVVGANSSGVISNMTMKMPCFWNLVNRMYQPVGSNPPVFVENVKDHLGRGQFYFDKARQTIYYVPLHGQDMGAVKTVVALEQTLIRFQNASNQIFEGVTMEHTTWLRPGQADGYVEQQSGACDDCVTGTPISGKTGGGVGCGLNDTYVITPGAVMLEHTSDVSFINCTYGHLGAYATAARGGSKRITWRGCTFDDLSSGEFLNESSSGF
jgi:hypothetical protein